jgi:hypothetical protein
MEKWILGVEDALRCIISNKACVAKRIPVIEQKLKFLENHDLKDTSRQIALWEKLYLGIALSASAADDYEKVDKDIKSCKDTYFIHTKEKATVHCVIDNVHLKKTGEKSKNPGQEYCILDISDNSGALQSVFVWPELYYSYKDEISPDVVGCLTIKRTTEWQSLLM